MHNNEFNMSSLPQHVKLFLMPRPIQTVIGWFTKWRSTSWKIEHVSIRHLIELNPAYIMPVVFCVTASAAKPWLTWSHWAAPPAPSAFRLTRLRWPTPNGKPGKLPVLPMARLWWKQNLVKFVKSWNFKYMDFFFLSDYTHSDTVGGSMHPWQWTVWCVCPAPVTLPVNDADMMATASEVILSQFQTVPLSESHFSGQPYSVSVLKVGYCLSQTDGTFRADGTITLITGPRTILVDTGGPWDRNFLLMTLKDRGLKPGDINLVVGTHGHSDHVGNLSLFPTAVMIVGYDISEGDLYLPNRLAEGHAYSIDEHVSICKFLLSHPHSEQDLKVKVVWRKSVFEFAKQKMLRNVFCSYNPQNQFMASKKDKQPYFSTLCIDSSVHPGRHSLWS